MISTRFYLDTRHGKEESPLKLCITKRSKCAYITLDLTLTISQWDPKNQKVINHPRRKQINSFITGFKYEVDEFIRPRLIAGELKDMTAIQIKELVRAQFVGERKQVTLGELWRSSMGDNPKKQTMSMHCTALYHLKVFDPKCETRFVSAITRDYISRYDKHLKEHLAQTTRNTYMARLLYVLHFAHKNGIITADPSKGVSLPYVQNKKRNLSAQQLRKLLNAQPIDDQERNAIAFFKFSFCCRAANPADILAMTEDMVFNGRIEYDRAKTGKHYSVKIEPELQELIDMYSGNGHLFYSAFKDGYFRSVSGESLQAIAKRLKLPPVTMYWARHTFASLAYEIGESMDSVSQLLGHSYGAKVTQGYVAISTHMIDMAARRVLDFALYDKK